MRTRALLIAAMLVPAAYGQLPSARRSLDPPIADVYTSINVRPEKVQPFRARAAELNQRRAALEEEGRKIDEVASQSSDKPVQPPAAGDYDRRVEAWRGEVRAFRRETAEEFRVRRNQAGIVAKSLGSWQDAIDDAAASLNPEPTAPNPPPPPIAPKTAIAPVPPATGPKPSSVPGLPAGMEPEKKAKTNLPPGMSKR